MPLSFCRSLVSGRSADSYSRTAAGHRAYPAPAQPTLLYLSPSLTWYCGWRIAKNKNAFQFPDILKLKLCLQRQSCAIFLLWRTSIALEGTGARYFLFTLRDGCFFLDYCSSDHCVRYPFSCSSCVRITERSQRWNRLSYLHRCRCSYRTAEYCTQRNICGFVRAIV